MLRIDRQSDAGQSLALILQGELTGAWVALLQEVCERHLRSIPADQLQLDLGGVGYVNRAGRRLLLQLRELGVELRQCPPLIEAQLGEDADAADDP